MYLVLVMAYLSLFAAIVGTQFLMVGDLGVEARTVSRSEDLSAVSSEVHRYFVETGAYPSSISSLATHAGFEHVRLRDSTAVSYGTTSTPLTSSLFQFHRAALVSQDYRAVVSDTAIFADSNNTCESVSFASASTWCGRKADNWWVEESKDIIPADIARQRMLLTKLARKLALMYSATGSFPNPGAVGTYALKDLAAYGGDATSCSGSFSWSNVPLGCDDLYGIHGQPVAYRYASSKSIDVAAQLNHRDATGTQIVVILPLDLP